MIHVRMAVENCRNPRRCVIGQGWRKQGLSGIKAYGIATAAIKQKSFSSMQIQANGLALAHIQDVDKGLSVQDIPKTQKKEPERKKFFQVFSVAFACQTGHAYYEQGKGRQCAPMRPQENRLGQDLRLP